MAKFKKFAMLCMAFLMTASIGLIACGETGEKASSSEPPASSEETSDVTSDVTSEETSDVTSEEPEEEVPVYLVRGENTVSVAAGETVDLQLAVPGLMLGAQLGLTWTSENAAVYVSGSLVEGTYATLEITPMFTLALSTKDGAAEDIVLTIGEAQAEAAPVAVLGENAVEVSAELAGWGVELTFTAEETAMYTISTEDTNGFIFWGNNDGTKMGAASTEEASEVGLEAGETINLSVSTNNYMADTIEFTITKSGTYDPFLLSVGDNNLKVKKADTEAPTYTFTAPADGNYTVSSWSSNDPANGTTEEPVAKAIAYTVNGETKYVMEAAILLTLKKDDVVTFTAYVYDENSFFNGICTLDLAITEVAVAGEATTVTIEFNTGSLKFYATEAGIYTITVTEGAKVVQYDYINGTSVVLTEFEVEEANTIIYLTVESETLTEATVTITKAA